VFAGANPVNYIEFDGHEPITSYNPRGRQQMKDKSGDCFRDCNDRDFPGSEAPPSRTGSPGGSYDPWSLEPQPSGDAPLTDTSSQRDHSYRKPPPARTQLGTIAGRAAAVAHRRGSAGSSIDLPTAGEIAGGVCGFLQEAIGLGSADASAGYGQDACGTAQLHDPKATNAGPKRPDQPDRSPAWPDSANSAWGSRACGHWRAVQTTPQRQEMMRSGFRRARAGVDSNAPGLLRPARCRLRSEERRRVRANGVGVPAARSATGPTDEDRSPRDDPRLRPAHEHFRVLQREWHHEDVLQARSGQAWASV
jgi:hypothetical protein